MDKDKTQTRNAARREYRGMDMDIADSDKDTKCLEKQDTRILNNNPRNGDGPQP